MNHQMPSPLGLPRMRPIPVALPAAPVHGDKSIKTVRRLIYLYLILLLIEGALRKWVLPQLANPLLIVRDPVVILIYLFAIAGGVFPRNRFVISISVIAILSWITGILVLLPYLSPELVIFTTGFGFRSNFLHLPLIFVIPAVFSAEHVKRIGWWTILGMIPMAVLMALQFKASPDSFINRAAGLGEGQQIQTTGGKIRPPGTFSFITGTIYYLSTTTAFLLHAALSKFEYKNWFLFASGLSLIVGIGVSGSRGAVLAVALVVATLSVILLIRPDAMTKFGRNLLLAAIVAWAVSYVPVFREGVGLLTERFTESAEAADTTVIGGTMERMLSGFTEPLEIINKAPFWGYGLGVGTNGGARFLTGRSAFLLTENEWSRILLESGPILGLAFLFWRTALAFYIGFCVFRQLTLGNILPIFLFGAGFFALLDGSFGQPTSLGFAVVLNGLCLAAMNVPKTELKPVLGPKRPAAPRISSRSVHAERLHRPVAPENGQNNGSADR
jgi:hypothetical protein